MAIRDSKAIASCVKGIPCTRVGGLSLSLMCIFPSKDVDHQLALHSCWQKLLTKGRTQRAVRLRQMARVSLSQEDTSGWWKKGAKSQSSQAYPVEPQPPQWASGQGPTWPDTGCKGVMALCLGKAVPIRLAYVFERGRAVFICPTAGRGEHSSFHIFLHSADV